MSNSKFETTMRQLESMLNNVTRLKELGIKVEIGHIITACKPSGKYHPEWIFYEVFNNVAEFNYFCELFFRLTDVDEGETMFEYISSLRKKAKNNDGA